MKQEKIHCLNLDLVWGIQSLLRVVWGWEINLIHHTKFEYIFYVVQTSSN